MAFSSLSTQSFLPELSENPIHPCSSFSFRKRAFGIANQEMRSCQSDYFEIWPWLTYDIEKDVVFCHLCVKSLQKKKMTAKKADPSFTQKGFSYWKDATIAFKSTRHRIVTRKLLRCQLLYLVLALMLRKCFHLRIVSKEDNRECLLKIISNLKFLTRQGLPLRGDGDTDLNFTQLMKLHARDDPRLTEWLEKKTNLYISHDIQNELLKVMALSVLREI
ncbi:hypothetical protein LOD99_1521 [Oopsacas minuta]|uniref:TTF-type domain-containing protein n=1 Tax=Oopsacas minuta TaxID=111878 RepID=A0AAV7K4L8_9METZ|nr:hypothetical protein LOD99_1521 [Oopsacas minuta]